MEEKIRLLKQENNELEENLEQLNCQRRKQEKVVCLSSLFYSNKMFVCVFVTYLLRNGWTDLAKLFFVISVLVTVWFYAKQIPDLGSGFSGNPEKPGF